MDTHDEGSKVLVSFGAGSIRWADLSDPVTGGLSRSQLLSEDGIGVFSGVVSLERNGGFASVRSAEGHFELSGFSGLTLRLRGDGKHYGLRLRTSASFEGVNYQADFATTAGAWLDVVLPFERFAPVFRGRPVPGHPPLDRAAVRSLGLIIAGRQEGPFRLELGSIRGY